MNNVKQTPAVLSALADPTRLKLLLELIDETGTDDNAGRARHISRLANVGLVDERGQVTLEHLAQLFSMCLDEVRSILHHNRTPETRKHDLSALPFDNASRLKEIPSNPKLRSTLLAWLADEVLPAGELTEKEVNLALSSIADDYVMLRRYLVDANYIRRTQDGSVYWKADT